MNGILNKLSQHGYRLTQPRKQILEALSFHPQSVTELAESLKKKQAKVDMATVYRTLEVLIGLGVVGKTVLGDSGAHFELLSEDHHHHHLICKDCGSIEDIPLDEDQLLHQVQDKTKFKVQSHSLEFFGLCLQCQ